VTPGFPSDSGRYGAPFVSTFSATEKVAGSRRVRDWLGDRILLIVTAGASLLAAVVLGLIVWKIIDSSRIAFDKFGISFLWGTVWDANPLKNVYGAGTLIYGTFVTSLMALVIAVPLAIAIALFLSELAPKSVRGIVGPLVEMLAAIPSVVLGLWGILILGPFLADHVEPWLNRWFGFLPIFGGTFFSSGVFIAGVILAIMVVPIVASICRELFLSVPRELEEGAIALGATRWEMVRGVVLHSSRSGIAAAVILGLGRAIGEAIAVTQVIGAATAINISLFPPGDTLASRIAGQYQGAVSNIQISALFYLAAILLAIGLLTNLLAQFIVRRFDVQRSGAR
jgi:phosphate transport system permease protein